MEPINTVARRRRLSLAHRRRIAEASLARAVGDSVGGSGLLQTKLTAPRLADESTLLVRSDLLAGIRNATAARLVVVCAPAGYGKSTLVAQAASGGDRRLAWLSLDERDNEPGRFVAYVAGALQRANPALGDRSAGERASRGAGVAESVITAILNDLARSPDAMTLVVDDYHRIDNPAVHQLMDNLVRFMPPQLRLVLISRMDPPLALARLRVRGELLKSGPMT
jgi:LuxR family maltose regulon positive regulatory protein